MNLNNLPRKLWDLLGSRRFSVFVFILGMVSSFNLLSYVKIMPAAMVAGIAGTLPFQILYVLFFINMIICMIKWTPVVLAKCRRATEPHNIEECDKFPTRIELKNNLAEDENFLKFFRQRGYRLRKQNGEAQSFYAVRGQYASLGTLFFHFSYFFILFGVLTSMLFRFEGKSPYPEGYTFNGERSDYTMLVEAPLASFPEVKFHIDQIRASFWDGRRHFTYMGADITHENQKDTLQLSKTVNIGGADVTATTYAFAPTMILKDKNGVIADQKPLLLRIFFAGSREHFLIPGLPHKIFVTFYTDAALKDKGLATNDPPDPAYRIEVVRGRLLIYDGVIRPGQWAEFDGISLTFTDELRRWIEITVIDDPGFYLIWTAFLMMIGGLIMRMVFYKREVIIYRDSNQQLWLAGRFEYYRELNRGWLTLLAEKFERN